jgi:thioredoxin reductase
MQHDVIVVGGSYAGLTAATFLARGLHSTCVIDAGAPRNRFSPAAHGFFGQDGAKPADMIRVARDQLARYPGVTFVGGLVTGGRTTGDGVTVVLDSGEEVSARKLIIAAGVRDELPDVPGLPERWGKSVLHCPYCHGYEFAGQRLGVLGLGPISEHQAQMISNWGPTTYFANGQAVDAELEAKLAAKGVTIETSPVSALEGEGAGLSRVRLADGRHVPLDALYIAPVSRPSVLAEQLGCEHEDGPLGITVRIDAANMTTVPGVYAAGDLARQPSNAMLAAADGVRAGSAVSQALIFNT